MKRVLSPRPQVRAGRFAPCLQVGGRKNFALDVFTDLADWREAARCCFDRMDGHRARTMLLEVEEGQVDIAISPRDSASRRYVSGRTSGTGWRLRSRGHPAFTYSIMGRPGMDAMAAPGRPRRSDSAREPGSFYSRRPPPD